MASKSLGTLTLDLVAKTAGFVQGMSKAERESAKWKRNVKKNIDETGRALKNLSIIASGALAASFGAVVAASARQEAAIKQVEQRLISTGNAAGKTSEGLQKVASELQRTTTFGDESVLEMQSILLTFTNIRGEIFDRTLPAILDLSTAMGSDLKSSALQLGKALNDPVKGVSALAESGIQFTDSQKKIISQMVSTGDTAGAQTMILKELETQFGGAATAAADTFGGALKQVQNAFGDLLENPSGLEANKEALKEFADFLQDPAIVKAANDLTSALIKGFGEVAASIRTTVGLFQFLGEEFAAITSGAASDDLVRLQNELAKARSALENPSERIRIGGPGGWIAYYNEDELRAEIAELEAAIDAEVERLSRKYRESLLQDIVPQGARVTGSILAPVVDDLEKISVIAKKREMPEYIKEALDLQIEYQRLVGALRTDEEVVLDTLRERLNLLERINAAYGDAKPGQGEARARSIGAAFGGDAPDYSGLSPEIGGAFSEFKRIEDAREQLEDWYSDKIDLLREAREQELITQDEYNSLELAQAQKHQDALAEIEQARQYVALATAEETFGSLADIAKQFAGEQSDAYKVLFAFEKGVAIARSIIAIQTAIAQAAASGPFPANLAAMATVAAQTASIIANIQSASIAGQAHDGMMSVPKTGTYILEKGERVVSAETTKKMDQKLAGFGSDPQVNLRVINAYDSSVMQEYMGSSEGERIVMNHVKRNAKALRSIVT